MPVEVRQLSADDLWQMLELLDLFSDVFDDPESYARKRPRAGYLQQLLASDTFIAVVATQDDLLVGGLAAYELHKFEQERSEIYIYDLAVRPTHRRQRIATRMIEELRRIAALRNAWIIFVQADTGTEDLPAVALYTKLGVREDVLHFDIPIKKDSQ